MDPAPIARRAVAAMVDLFIFYLIQFVSLAIVVSVIPWNPVARPVTTASLVAATLLVLLAGYGALEVLGGRSFGKRALKLGVRLATGGKAAPGRLALRWLIKVLPITAFFALAYTIVFGAWSGDRHQPLALVVVSTACGLLLFAVLGDFLVALGPARRAGHDHMTGTAVARAVRL